MGQLIDDLLKLARVTRAELNVGTVDLSALATSVFTRLSAAQPDRVVDWRVQDALSVSADGRLLEIAITNLIDNAWKFTGNESAPRIEFGMRNGTGRQREYFVRDNGAGFDPAYASKLFHAFQRLHRATDFSGTGIGLATVQRIITRHGGQVRAEGAPGEGATFAFTLQSESHP
jgi:light-regulated signal transduction histidine kinase (bacteriophytochrome)